MNVKRYRKLIIAAILAIIIAESFFRMDFLLWKEPNTFMVLSDDFNVLSSTGALKNLDKLIKNDKDFNNSKYYYSNEIKLFNTVEKE